MEYKVVIMFSSQNSKTFTEFSSEEEARTFCIECGTKGVFLSGGNENETFYYPPQRINLIQILPDDEIGDNNE